MCFRYYNFIYLYICHNAHVVLYVHVLYIYVHVHVMCRAGMFFNFSCGSKVIHETIVRKRDGSKIREGPGNVLRG